MRAPSADTPATRSRRFYRLGASNAPLWRNAIEASPYADLLPRLDAGWLLTSSPQILAARLFSRRCAYCTEPGEYWFTLQGRRVCRGCFELDIQQGATRTEFPTTTLSDFLTLAPATEDAAAGSAEAGAGAAATTVAGAAAPGARAGDDQAGAEASADGAAAGTLAPTGAAAGAAAPAPRRPPLCAYVSKSLAKTLFCLGDKELNALRSLTLTGADVRRTGIGMGADAKITLVTAGDCLAAAVARFGSQAALVAEVEARRASAQATLDAKRAEGKSPAMSPYLKSTCNFPHLNQSRHSVFSVQTGFGLEYAVRSPFFSSTGGRVLRVGVPGTAAAAGADYVSFEDAMKAATTGDVVELLPGVHDLNDIYDDDDNDGGGIYITEAITIRGVRGANGVRPLLRGARRVLVIINSCVIRDVTFQSTQSGMDYGFFPTVLVCNVSQPVTNSELCVEFEDCELRAANAWSPYSFGMMVRVQNGAPAERTLIELKRCTVGRASRPESVRLRADAACDINVSVADDE